MKKISKFRKLIKDILRSKVNLVVVDIPVKQFIYFDKTDKGWRLTISKSLIGDN